MEDSTTIDALGMPQPSCGKMGLLYLPSRRLIAFISCSIRSDNTSLVIILLFLWKLGWAQEMVQKYERSGTDSRTDTIEEGPAPLVHPWGQCDSYSLEEVESLLHNLISRTVVMENWMVSSV